MASLRKRYQGRVEASGRQDGPPVTTPPTGAAKLPDAVADPKPLEMPEAESPVDAAAKNALRERLREMESAEALSRRQPQQQPQYAAEPQQQQPQQPAMPAHVQEWLSRHPQYTDPNDQIAQAEINLATMKCVRDGLTWNDDNFLPSIERHLGIAPRANGQSQHRPPAPRSEPVRQQQRSNVPMSAPPTRGAPSMSTGRPASRRAPLTPEQIDAARFSGISVEEYERQLRRMEAMKAAGQLDDRG